MAVALALVRIALGALLLVAGVFKAHDGPAAVAMSIAGYRLLPQVLVAPLALVLPWAEIALGLLLVAGAFTRTVATVVTVQFVVFAFAVATLVVRQIPADCGCFGSAVPTPPSWGHVGLDLLLAVLAFALARWGPGMLSYDGRRMARV